MPTQSTTEQKVFTREFFQKAGSEGGKIGGHLVWAGMTPEERSAKVRANSSQRKWRPFKKKAQAEHSPQTKTAKAVKKAKAVKRTSPKKKAA